MQSGTRAVSSDQVSWSVDRNLPKWWMKQASVELSGERKHAGGMDHARQCLHARAQISQILCHG
eukprot:5377749-Pyramimonas_sp.AAC.1